MPLSDPVHHTFLVRINRGGLSPGKWLPSHYSIGLQSWHNHDTFSAPALLAPGITALILSIPLTPHQIQTTTNLLDSPQHTQGVKLAKLKACHLPRNLLSALSFSRSSHTLSDMCTGIYGHFGATHGSLQSRRDSKGSTT